MSKIALRNLLGIIVFSLMGINSHARIIKISPDDSVQLDAVPRGRLLNLVSWNTHKYDNAQSFRDLQTLTKQTDFTLLQETLFNNHLAAVFQRLAHFFWLGVESFKEAIDTGTGVQTGSRFQVAKHVGITTIGREPLLYTPKAMLVTYYKTVGSDETLAVSNLHALNFVSTSVFRSQLVQLHKELESHQGPMIVAGDFNTHLPGRFVVLKEFANELGMNWVQMPNDSRFLKLDHVLVRGVHVQRAAVRTDIKTSDHFPLAIDFSLPDPH